jgi:hypothetical protein
MSNFAYKRNSVIDDPAARGIYLQQTCGKMIT